MRVVHEDAFLLVGLPLFTPPTGYRETMDAAWELFIRRHNEVPLSCGEPFAEVLLGPAGGEAAMLVGTRVWQLNRVPPAMQAIEVPPQRYLYLRHEGPRREIPRAFQRIRAHARTFGVHGPLFHIDLGYTISGHDDGHDLFVALGPDAHWRPR